MMNDGELLGLYARSGSESAFSELVARHLPLVYSAALRQTSGDPELARDVAQSVFIDLAKKARSLSRHPVLAGWLHTSTRFAAASLRRAEQRRLARERLAVAMQDQTTTASSPDWDQISPVLDEAIGALNEEDRTAVLLRYFENQELKAIGGALGVTDDAARMRVNRALAKLHALLSARGVTLSAASLGTVLTIQSVSAVPAGLAAAIAGNVFAATAAGGTGGWLAAAVETARLKWTAALIPGAVLLVVIVAGVYLGMKPPRPSSVPVSQPLPGPPQTGSALVDAESNAAPTQVQIGPKKTGPAEGELQLRLVDARTTAPLPDGKVYASYFGEGGASKSARSTSDTDGIAYLELPRAPFNSANIFVTTDGHVPVVVSYDAAMAPEYTLKIEPGTQAGGLIVDEDGHPVPGAQIEFDGPGIDTAKKVNVQFGPDTKQTSDSAGRWFCDIIPRELESISVVLTHPDYAATTATAPANTAAATNSVLTIKPGVTVSGVVQDSTGWPIEHATVRQIHNRYGPKVSATTDVSGGFELKHVPAGELMLAVQADKFAPTVLETNLSIGNVQLKFVLGSGKIFRGRVVDDRGAPITNAIVKTDSDNQGLRKIEWSTRTDSEGRFEWDSAPAEPLLYWFQAAGFEWIRMRLMKADGTDHEIKLARKGEAKEPQTRITGTVLDAETGAPLDQFRVLMGDVQVPFSEPDFHFATDGKEGTFSLPLRGRVYPTFQIQIQKDGYLPVASSNLSLSAGSQHLHFQLHKGDGPSGIVLLPNGEPAANATVFLYETRGGVYMDKPGQYRKEAGISTAARVATDATGKFRFEPRLQARGFIVLHEQGFVDVPFNQFNGTLQLQPWGRVEGKLRLGTEVGANRKICLGNVLYRYGDTGRQFPALSLWLEAVTDSTGNFAFDKVPPGERRIAVRLDTPPGPGPLYDTHDQTIQVAPGTITRVDLGLGGATVSGRVIFPSGTNSLDWRGVLVEMTTRDPEYRGPRPLRADFDSNDAFIEAMKAYSEADRAFWTSEAGRQLERNRQKFATYCGPDGSFVIPGVTAGNYMLKVDVRQKPSVGAGPSRTLDPFNTAVIASLSLDLTVPEPGETADNSFNLGILELKPAEKITAKGLGP